MDEGPSTTTLKSADGFSLFCQVWRPADLPLATVILVHGLGEHSGRYEHVARYFTDKDYAVFAADLRGHGRSEGTRGHIDSFDDYLNDVQALFTYARNQVRARPRFLIGHSMGGLIALTYALKYTDGLTSVIASGPGLRVRVRVPTWRTTLGNLMSKLYPTLPMRNGLDPNALSRDQAVVRAYIADPLVHDQVSARWYTEFVKAGQEAIAQANTLAVPALILQGGADPIVDPTGAKEFFNRIGLEEKHHLEYPGLYHEIFNEPEKFDVLDDVNAWIVPRLHPQIVP
jgi:lysophospholipase